MQLQSIPKRKSSRTWFFRCYGRPSEIVLTQPAKIIIRRDSMISFENATSDACLRSICRIASEAILKRNNSDWYNQIKMPWMDRFGLRGFSTATTMNVFFIYYVCATSIDSFSEPEVNETTGITWPSLYRRLRSASSNEPCRHGSPSRDFPHRCVCESNFSGDLCQRLNVSAIGQVVLGGTVILHWDRPPRLRGYSVVFQEARNTTGPTPGSRLQKTPIIMREDSRSLLLDNLKGGGTPYWVCIEEDATADLAVSTQTVDRLTSCLYVSTLPDYDSMAGWALALSLSGLTVLLIYLQRDKIELLYFSRPMTGYYEPVQQIHHQGDQESVTSNHVATRNPPTSIGSHP